MNDDELVERVARTLHAKAEQVRDQHAVVDPSTAIATLDATPVPRSRGWWFALAAAAVVIAGVAVGAAVAIRHNTDPTPASPRPLTTSTGIAVTTAPTTTASPTTVASRPLALDGWTDTPDAGPSGTVAVDRFNALLDAQTPDWQNSPVDVAVVFSHFAIDATTERGHIATNEVVESSTRERVLVTLTGIGDDSVAAERYDVVLVRTALGWRPQSANWTQRCQPRRGHQDFTTELCV